MGKRAAVKRAESGKDKREAKAILRTLRTSPIKLNQVCKLIRGRKVEDAVTQLAFSSRRIANDVRKAVQSAVANAENTKNLDVDSLYVAEAFVSKAFVMKRFHARARGRGARILKPFSNLTIIVRERAADQKETA